MAETVSVTKVIEIDVKPSAEAAAHLKAIADSMNSLDKNAKNAGTTLSNTLGLLKGLAGLQVFDIMSSNITKGVMALNSMNEQANILGVRMGLITKNSADSAKAFQDIVDISVHQGRELDAVAKLFEKVQRNAETMGLSLKGVSLITEGMAASLRLSGAGTQEANAAMLQFSQSIASGKLQGDEFRSLMENDSIFMAEFAKGLGKTSGELRAMAKAGELTGDVMKQAMFAIGTDGMNMLQRLMDQADKLPKTFAQAVEGTKASLIDLVKALQETGTKTESIFAGMARRIGEYFRKIAQETRDATAVAAEKSRILGEQGMGPARQKDIDPKAQRALDQFDAIKKNQGLLTDAMQQVSIARISYNRALELYGKGVLSDTAKDKLADAIDKAAGYQAEITVARDIINAQAVQIDTESNTGFSTHAAEKGPQKKKPKGPDTARDVMEAIQESMENEAGMLQDIESGKTKTLSKLEEMLNKLDKVASGGLTSEEIEAFKAVMRRQETMNDETRKAIEWIKQQEAAGPFMSAQVQASDERVLRKFDSDLTAALNAAAKYKKEDPTAEADVIIGKMQTLRADALLRGRDADAQVIADYIIEVRDAALEKVAKNKPKTAMQQMQLDMQDQWKASWDTMLNEMLDFSKSAKDIAEDLVKSLLMKFAKIQLENTLNPMFQAGSRALDTMVTSFMSASAMGNVFQGGIRQFGMGGVLNGPTPFSYNGGRSAGLGGEAGPEALVPLARDSSGKLGLGATPVTVLVINNADNSKATATDTTNANGERQIKVLIENTVNSSLGSGRHDAVLGKSFGLSRKGG